MEKGERDGQFIRSGASSRGHMWRSFFLFFFCVCERRNRFHHCVVWVSRWMGRIRTRHRTLPMSDPWPNTCLPVTSRLSEQVPKAALKPSIPPSVNKVARRKKHAVHFYAPLAITVSTVNFLSIPLTWIVIDSSRTENKSTSAVITSHSIAL